MESELHTYKDSAKEPNAVQLTRLCEVGAVLVVGGGGGWCTVSPVHERGFVWGNRGVRAVREEALPLVTAPLAPRPSP